MNEMTAAEAAENLEEQDKYPVTRLPKDREALQFAVSILRHIASGEYAPVVHVQWFRHDDGSVTCLHCHRRMVKSACGWPRCPNCGALMDGKDELHE